MMRTDFWWYSSVASFWISSSILSTSLIKSRRKEKNSSCMCLYACASQTIHTVYTSYTRIAVTCIKTVLSILLVQFSGLKTLQRMRLQKLLLIATLHIPDPLGLSKAKFRHCWSSSVLLSFTWQDAINAAVSYLAVPLDHAWFPCAFPA